MRRITGIVFSDLGRASTFMGLDWVQSALKQTAGFAPFPATLNVRPKTAEDERLWRAIRNGKDGRPLLAPEGDYCSARVYNIEIFGPSCRSKAAVVVPEIANYPINKIEIVAPMRVKDAFGVKDGDPLVLEFAIE